MDSASQAVHFHPFEEQDPYGANENENSTVKENPIKRLRWATKRAKPSDGLKKRASILKRFQHGRSPSGKSTGSDGSEDSDETVASSQTASMTQPRTIFFNQDLPASARDEEGHPLIHYPRNKIRTAKYTALSFVPKNLWFQFHNIANVYFLFIIILGVCSSFVHIQFEKID